jgi:hypothetical protein
MASGKQTSFQFGEVSPSLQFRSDAVSYTAGLSKLKNMYVRRASGVSNRAGLELVEQSEFQQDIPPVGADPEVKGFTTWDVDIQEWKTYEYGKLYNPAFDRYEYGFLAKVLSVSKKIFPSDDNDVITGVDRQFITPIPKDIVLTPSRNGIFVAPSALITTSLGGGIPSISIENVVIRDDKLDRIRPFGTSDIATTFAAVAYFSPTGGATAPRIECSYLITGINSDDVEIYLNEIPKLLTPNSFLRNDITINFTSGAPELKRINIYRAAAKDETVKPFFKLVGQIIPSVNAATFTFSDYGAEDVTRTPPLDITFFRNTIAINFGFDLPNLGGVNVFANYQQRMIAAVASPIIPSTKPGDLLASKIGAPLEFSAPLIYTNTGAFQFSVPLTDGTPVIAMLPMERLIAFTERGVYAIRGGEQGALTPTSINPLQISEEGCSKTVQPKMAGSKGYFINNAHTKLMFIVFGDDGNLRVSEASVFSDHTLFEGIVQLEVLSTGDDTVYLLRRDGKIIQVTVTEEGAHGFSILETNGGYVESIFRGKAKKNYVKNIASTEERFRNYDVLMCYVIRNGKRYLEKLGVRDDMSREGELFLDCSVRGGRYLTLSGADGYLQLDSKGFTFSGKINIEPSDPINPVWNAGQTIEIRSNIKLSDLYKDIPDQDKVIHFYYNDNQYIRYFIDLSSETLLAHGDFLYSYEGYFTSDVPEELRDVFNKNLTTIESAKRLSRWLPAYKIIDTTAESFLFDQKYNLLWDAINVDNLAEGSYPIGVYADGEVISSPLNPFMPTTELKKLSSGKIEIDLGDYYSYWHVGIPYECEFETLDLETAGERTVTDAKKLINAVGLGLMETRGGFAGIPEQTLQNMTPIVTREDESFNNQTKNFNGHIVVHIPTEWNEPGRATIKHVDPTPISILSVYPKGMAGD